MACNGSFLRDKTPIPKLTGLICRPVNQGQDPRVGVGGVWKSGLQQRLVPNEFVVVAPLSTRAQSVSKLQKRCWRTKSAHGSREARPFVINGSGHVVLQGVGQVVGESVVATSFQYPTMAPTGIALCDRNKRKVKVLGHVHHLERVEHPGEARGEHHINSDRSMTGRLLLLF